MVAKPDPLRVQIARRCSEKSMCGSRTLKKLNDKHRQGAMLIARGMTFRQIGEELGGHPGYWGQLARWSPLFQECVEHYRQILENARNRALEVQRAENVRRQRRRTRPVTPFVSGIIVERRARAERLRQAEAQAPAETGECEAGAAVKGGFEAPALAASGKSAITRRRTVCGRTPAPQLWKAVMPETCKCPSGPLSD